jgi:hypothetical protein
LPLPLRSLVLLTPARQTLYAAGGWLVPGLLFGIYLPNDQFPLDMGGRGLLGAMVGAVLGALSGLIGWVLGRKFGLQYGNDLPVGGSIVGVLVAAGAALVLQASVYGTFLAVLAGLMAGLIVSMPLAGIEYVARTSLGLTAAVLGMVLGGLAGTVAFPLLMALFAATVALVIGGMAGVLLGALLAATSAEEGGEVAAALKGSLRGLFLGPAVAGASLILVASTAAFGAPAVGGCLAGQGVGALLGGCLGTIIQNLEEKQSAR